MYRSSKEVEFNTLIGKTFKQIKVISKHLVKTYNPYEYTDCNDAVIFECEDGSVYELTHDQDCCEEVHLEDVVGKWTDLIGSPILKADEKSNSSSDEEVYTKPVEEDDESYTWTFYTLATIKGYVDLRFYGTSNGYYSEEVRLYKLGK